VGPERSPDLQRQVGALLQQHAGIAGVRLRRGPDGVLPGSGLLQLDQDLLQVGTLRGKLRDRSLVDFQRLQQTAPVGHEIG